MNPTSLPTIGDLGNFLSPDVFDALAAEFDRAGRPGLPPDFLEQQERAMSDPDDDADTLALHWLHAFHLWAWPILAQRFAEAHRSEMHGLPVFIPSY